MDSENISLIQCSVSDGPKTRSSKDISLLGTVELQWNHENMFETGAVAANEC